jgi:hypothetical protein
LTSVSIDIVKSKLKIAKIYSKNIMQNDKEKIKNEFRLRIKKFILDLIKFLNGLSKTSSNEVIGRQLLRI